MTYPVTEIFHSLQGEGHFVGYPMVFVRLAGCRVGQCHIRKECDEAPWKAKETLDARAILERVGALRTSGIVCITGGEPTDHDIVPLVATLHGAGYRVHLETSGVRPVTGLPLEWLTVSPKDFGPGGLVQRSGHTLKIVVRPEWSRSEAWDRIKGIDAGTEFFHRYLQPLTAGGLAANLREVIALLSDAQNGGGRWALSVQAHRSWGLP